MKADSRTPTLIKMDFKVLPAPHLKDMVLLDGDALRVPHLQAGEEDVQRGFVPFFFLLHLGCGQHLHDHAEVLFLRRRFVFEVQDQRLQQRRFGFLPEGVGRLRSGRGGGLDEGFNQAKHVLVVPDIGQGVVAERGVRIQKIEHPHLIPIGLQRPAGFPQDLRLGVADDQGAVPAV